MELNIDYKFIKELQDNESDLWRYSVICKDIDYHGRLDCELIRDLAFNYFSAKLSEVVKQFLNTICDNIETFMLKVTVSINNFLNKCESNLYATYEIGRKSIIIQFRD